MFYLDERPLTPEQMRQEYIDLFGLEATLKKEEELGHKIGE